MDAPLLEMRRLSVVYRTSGGPVRAVRDVDLTIRKGDIVGIVGESGSGKTSLVSAIMTLLPPKATIEGQILFGGRDLYGLDAKQRRALRGNGIATIFQDPFTAFNPVTPIGRQLVEFQHWRRDLDDGARWRRAEEMLVRVGLGDPGLRMHQYPHQLSGGIRQRIGIAAALLTDPLLLIADEPTTALDATTEMQIIELLAEARSMVDGAIVFVTHDMALVGAFCDRVAVMYAGELVEVAPVDPAFSALRHPYSRALLACDPARLPEGCREFPTIPGHVPAPFARRSGCIFEPRCGQAAPVCATTPPPAVVAGDGSIVRCHRVPA
ncbi:ABC transporter ATP-binding protein [Zavarzinia sp.]|uniref:ABC transporter ATP-binding protein n=1 Tax=Zavarzinia sp. TaxID=2027920 RepID=UPI00356851D3